MNWSIRIVLIVLIASGLLWLNWDRVLEFGREVETYSEEIIPTDDSQTVQTLPSKQVENHSSGQDTRVERIDSASEFPASPDIPDFELQTAPDSLDESDAQVRVVAQELAPEAAVWLEPEEQLRKWTLLVKQAAEGKTVYEDRPFDINLPAFAVEERNERYFISAANFKRYDAVVNALVKLPEDKLVAYYRAWYPLLGQAFGELGLPGDFDEKLDSVIERILAVNVLEPPIELKKPSSVTYKFLDPKLESASQIDKWLWRMGPEHTRQIQGLAARLKRELGKRR